MKKIEAETLYNDSLVDLHIHTSYSSDGDHSPDEVLAMARNIGLRAISIADNDVAEGVRLALLTAHDYNLEVLPNIEFTTFLHNKELHLLSYFIDIAAPGVISQLERIREFDTMKIQLVVARLQNIGIDVTYDEAKALSPRSVPKHSLVIKTAMTNGRNNGLRIFQDYIDGRRSDQPYHNFFLDHMRPGGDIYVEPLLRYSTIDAIALILSHGGLPVLAHPGGSLNLLEDSTIIDELRLQGLCGLEVYSSYHTEADEAFLIDYCVQHDLLITAGSDFHGSTIKPEIKMGHLHNNQYILVEHLKQKTQLIHGSTFPYNEYSSVNSVRNIKP